MDGLPIKKRYWMVKKRLYGASVVYLCERLDISRITFYYHWNNFQKFGWDGLKVKSRAPRTVYRTPQEVADKVIAIRKERGWGPDKIEQYLKSQGVMIGHTTIRKLLINARLNNFIDEPRKTWGKKRFERSHSNSLWQADFKLNKDDKWMITYLDDHSRFIPGSAIFENATSENAIDLLKRCISEFDTPEQILTDQGTQFHTTQADGITEFDKFCRRYRIEHIVASKRRPTTIGKVERFHGSYEREAWRFPSHGDYIKHWNYERPHQGIGYLIPADIYFKDRV